MRAHETSQTTPLDDLVTPRDEWPGPEYVRALDLRSEGVDGERSAGEMYGKEEDKEEVMKEDEEGDGDRDGRGYG